MFTVEERKEILERIIKFLKTLDVKLLLWLEVAEMTALTNIVIWI